MKKEKVFVKVRTSEEVKQVREILQKAGEPIYNESDILKDLVWGEATDADITFVNNFWQYQGSVYGLQQISIDKLATLLGVYEFKVGDRVNVISGANIGGFDNKVGVIEKVFGKDDYLILFNDMNHIYVDSKFGRKVVLELLPSISETACELPTFPCAAHDEASVEEIEKECASCEQEEVQPEDAVFQEAVSDLPLTLGEEIQLRASALDYASTTLTTSGDKLSAKELIVAAGVILKFLKGE